MIQARNVFIFLFINCLINLNFLQFSNVSQRKKKKNVDDKSFFPLYRQRRRLVTENLETGRFSCSMNSIEGRNESRNEERETGKGKRTPSVILDFPDRG